MLIGFKQALADLARPSAFPALEAAIFLAIFFKRDATFVGVLVTGLVSLYSAKAVENVGVAKHTGAAP